MERSDTGHYQKEMQNPNQNTLEKISSTPKLKEREWNS
jgi:hypothetical protein